MMDNIILSQVMEESDHCATKYCWDPWKKNYLLYLCLEDLMPTLSSRNSRTCCLTMSIWSYIWHDIHEYAGITSENPFWYIWVANKGYEKFSVNRLSTKSNREWNKSGCACALRSVSWVRNRKKRLVFAILDRCNLWNFFLFDFWKIMLNISVWISSPQSSRSQSEISCNIFQKFLIKMSIGFLPE